MKAKRLIFALAATLLIAACSKAPISGRKQVLLVSEGEMIQQSYAQYRQVMAQSKVLNNKDAQMVKKVGNNIANAVQRYFSTHPGQLNSNIQYQWEFNLIQDNTPNAWCMPGGKVAVYTGILPYTQNEQGLAVVMSHEIAHAIAQHSREQASYSVIQNLGGSIFSSLGLYPDVYNGATNLVMLKYSREHETEADQLGLIFMKLAGYDPNYAITFWNTMRQTSGTGQPEFLSTHPNDATRIENIKKYLQSDKFKNITD